MPKIYQHPGTGEEIELPDDLTDDDAIRAMYDYNSTGFEEAKPDELRKVFARSIERDVGRANKIDTGIAPVDWAGNIAVSSAKSFTAAIEEAVPAVQSATASFLKAVKPKDMVMIGGPEALKQQRAEEEFAVRKELSDKIQKEAEANALLPRIRRSSIPAGNTFEDAGDLLSPSKLIPAVAGGLGTTFAIASTSLLPGVGAPAALGLSYSYGYNEANEALKLHHPDMPEDERDSWARTYAIPAAALEYGGTVAQLGAATGRSLLKQAGYNLSEQAVEKLAKTKTGKLFFTKALSPMQGVATEVITENLQMTLQTGLVEGRLPSLGEYTATSVIAGLSAGTFQYGTHKLLTAGDPVARDKAVKDNIPLADQLRYKTEIAQYQAGEMRAEDFTTFLEARGVPIQTNREKFDVLGSSPEERLQQLSTADPDLYKTLTTASDISLLKTATGTEPIILNDPSVPEANLKNPINQFASGELVLEDLYEKVITAATYNDYTGFTAEQKNSLQAQYFAGNIFAKGANVETDPNRTLPFNLSAPLYATLDSEGGTKAPIARMAVDKVEDILWEVAKSTPIDETRPELGNFTNLGEYVNSPRGKIEFEAVKKKAEKAAKLNTDNLAPDENWEDLEKEAVGQDKDGVAAGLFTYAPGDRSLIQFMMGQADVSTIFHEITHLLTYRVAKGSNLERDMLGFANDSMKSRGKKEVKSLDQIDTQAHEALARFTEVYLLGQKDLSTKDMSPEQRSQFNSMRLLGAEMQRLYEIQGIAANNSLDVPDLGVAKNAAGLVGKGKSTAKFGSYNLNSGLNTIFYGGLKKGSFTVDRAQYVAEEVGSPPLVSDMVYDETEGKFVETPPADSGVVGVLEPETGGPRSTGANVEPQNPIVGPQSGTPGATEKLANGAGKNTPQPVVDRAVLHPDDPLGKIITAGDTLGRPPFIHEVQALIPGMTEGGAASAISQAYGNTVTAVKTWFPSEAHQNFHGLQQHLDTIASEGGEQKDVERRQAAFVYAIMNELGIKVGEGKGKKKESAEERQSRKRSNIQQALTLSKTYNEQMSLYAREVSSGVQGVLHIDAVSPVEGIPIPGGEGRFYQTQKVKNYLPDTKVVDERGMPKRVYHGTTAVFPGLDETPPKPAKFDKSRWSTGAGGDLWDKGFYFSEGTRVASGYAETGSGNLASKKLYLLEALASYYGQESFYHDNRDTSAAALALQAEIIASKKAPDWANIPKKKYESVFYKEEARLDVIRALEAYNASKVRPNIHMVYLDIKNPLDVDGWMVASGATPYDKKSDLIRALVKSYEELFPSSLTVLRAYENKIYSSTDEELLAEAGREPTASHPAVIKAVTATYAEPVLTETATKLFAALKGHLVFEVAASRLSSSDTVGSFLINLGKESAIKTLKEQKTFDGITHINRNGTGGVRQWIAWEPEQVHNFLQLTHGNKLAQMQKPKQTQTPEFKKWFGNSVVVGEDGEPLQMYHGTSKDKDFNKFNVGMRGVWFTPNPSDASGYAESNDSQKVVYENNRYVSKHTSSRVIPAYLRIENPYTLTQEEMDKLKYANNYVALQRTIFANAKYKGYDGVIWGDSHVVFDKSQIKSSIGNNGAFDSNNPSILEQNQRTNKADLYSQLHEKMRETKGGPARPGLIAETTDAARLLMKDRAVMQRIYDTVEAAQTKGIAPPLDVAEYRALALVVEEQRLRINRLLERGGSYADTELENYKNRLGDMYNYSFRFGSDIMNMARESVTFPTMVELAKHITANTRYNKIHAQMMTLMDPSDFNELSYTSATVKDAQELTEKIKEKGGKLSNLQQRLLSRIDFEQKDERLVRLAISEALLAMDRDSLYRELFKSMYITNILSNPGGRARDFSSSVSLRLFSMYIKHPVDSAVDLLYTMYSGETRTKFFRDSFISTNLETGKTKARLPFEGGLEGLKTAKDILTGKMDRRLWEQSQNLETYFGTQANLALMHGGNFFEKTVGYSLEVIPRIIVAHDALHRIMAEKTGASMVETAAARWRAMGPDVYDKEMRRVFDNYTEKQKFDSPEDKQKQFEEMMKNPVQMMRTAGHDFGNFVNLQNEPGYLTQLVAKAADGIDYRVYQTPLAFLSEVFDKIPVAGKPFAVGLKTLSYFSPMRMILPWSVVPANAIKEALSYVPASLGVLSDNATFGAFGVGSTLLSIHNDKGKGYSKEKMIRELVSRQLIAHALYYFLAWALDNGWYTGQPETPAEANTMKELGIKPYSFRVMWDGQPAYIPIPEPFAYGLVPVLQSIQMARRKDLAPDEKSAEKVVNKAIFSLQNYLRDSSYLGEALRTVSSSSGVKGVDFAKIANGWLPFSGFFRAINSTWKTAEEGGFKSPDNYQLQMQAKTNPTVENIGHLAGGLVTEIYGENIAKFFGQVIPGMEKEIPNRISYFGKELTREQILGMNIPWEWSPETPNLANDRLHHEFMSVGWYPGLPQREFERKGSATLKLTNEQYRSYCLRYGELFVEQGNALLNNPFYQRLPKDKKAEQLASTSSDARGAALSQVKMHYKLR